MEPLTIILIVIAAFIIGHWYNDWNKKMKKEMHECPKCHLKHNKSFW